MLAEGFGGRLEPTPDTPPKILLQFGGNPLMKRHAEILNFLGFDELVLGIGNKADRIKDEIAKQRLGEFVRTVDCPQFATGAPYTLWGLRAEFNGPVTLMDGDVFYDRRLMAKLCASMHEACFAMDRNIRPSDDQTKNCSREGEIVDFHMEPAALHDEYAMRCKFLKLFGKLAYRAEDALRPYIAAERTDFVYEKISRDIMRVRSPGAFRIADVIGMTWTEIDFPSGMAYAPKEILAAAGTAARVKRWLNVSPPWDQRIARVLVLPLAATTVSLLLGIGGVVLLAQGAAAAYWGGFLYMAALFVDHMDGELARQTGQISGFGHKYDHIAGGVFETALFCGIGMGLGADALGDWASILGFITAGAVAITVTIRLEISCRYGNDAIDQPSLFGFEIEDIMYLVGPIAWFDGLAVFLLLASIGLPIFMLVTVWDFIIRNKAFQRQAKESA